MIKRRRIVIKRQILDVYLDRLLGSRLTAAELRLALALALFLIEFHHRTEDTLYEETLCAVAHLDARALQRARAGLIDKGLIDFEPGDSRYRLRLSDGETPDAA